MCPRQPPRGHACLRGTERVSVAGGIFSVLSCSARWPPDVRMGPVQQCVAAALEGRKALGGRGAKRSVPALRGNPGCALRFVEQERGGWALQGGTRFCLRSPLSPRTHGGELGGGGLALHGTASEPCGSRRLRQAVSTGPGCHLPRPRSLPKVGRRQAVGLAGSD